MKQRPLLGFSLALIAAMTWGTLPIAAQQVLKVMDAQTLVWLRFVIASAGLLLILGFAKRLPKLTACSKKEFSLILLGVCGLAANFFLFAEALHYVSPVTNQVLWQLAPFSMILLGVLLFKEKFGFFQKLGFMLLIAGLIAFFNDKFAEILQLNTYALGVLLSAGASLIWVLYGVAQKLLLAKFNSQQVLFIIYIGCSLLMLPFATPAQLGELEGGFLWGCFIYCCLNTLIGYGSYGEALNHWDTSKVSIVTTMLPIFTMIFSNISHYFYPHIFAEPDMNWISYLGAFVVVGGAILAIAGDKLFKRG
ncbi:DMT family transporter [Mannheimia sp. HC-2023]|uniref:DMT family transporter n=1 Tax=Mannheimia indoligenes TaxID=3103145 RepID=UPI002FE5FB39